MHWGVINNGVTSSRMMNKLKEIERFMLFYTQLNDVRKEPVYC